MRKPCYLLLLLLCSPISILGQNEQYARNMMELLCSDSLAGRGYARNGMGKAAMLIQSEFEKMGLKSLPEKKDYLHAYSHPANIFQGEMKLMLDGKELKAGVDYLISPSSMGAKGKAAAIFADKDNFMHLSPAKVKNKALIVDPRNIRSTDSLRLFYTKLYSLQTSFKAWFEIANKLTWSASQSVQSLFPAFYIHASGLAQIRKSKKISWHVEQNLEKDFKAYNVAGMVEGIVKDTFVLVTAHYDHLGMMGKETYFKGANDNASGTVLMMDLAAHMVREKPKYSTVFVAFGSEEIGLVGSGKFVKDQYVPLNQIKAVLNIDLMGGGSEGVTVVNAVANPHLFECVKMANMEAGLSQVKERGAAANSDHHWFSENGVPAIFIYANGDVQAYHDINDVPEGLKWVHYEALFKLMYGFLNRL